MHSFKRQSLSKQLMDTIIQAITVNEFRVGEKLPPEAELAETFQISRNTLREVLKTLEQFGIIVSIHGQGTFVSKDAMHRIPNIEILQILSESADVQSLLDARIVIEPGLAKLSAERRTDSDIDLISESIGFFVNNSNNLESIFHLRIAQTAQSPLLYGYLQAVYKKLIHTPYPKVQELLLPDEDETEIREHKEILDSIIDRDGATARELMHLHLNRRFKLITEKDD